MSNMSTDIQVWLMRHGKTPSNYDKYDDFIQMLSNGQSTPLAKNPGINFKTLPKQVDFVGYSPFRRAIETAELLRDKLDVKHDEVMPILHEVRFDNDIILAHEFTSLEQVRPEIIRRWYNNENKAESFRDSLTRVREIESFLIERQARTIILVSHGWFLRLLEIYFVKGKHADITLEDILEVKPVPLGHCIMATVVREDLGGANVLGNRLVAQRASLSTETIGRRERYLKPFRSLPNRR